MKPFGGALKRYNPDRTPVRVYVRTPSVESYPDGETFDPLSPVFLEHVGVGHDRRARQDGLRGPQVLAEAPWPLHRVHQLAPGRGSSLDLEPEHGAMDAVPVLGVGQGLLGEASQSRVAYDVHLCFISVLLLLIVAVAVAVIVVL